MKSIIIFGTRIVPLLLVLAGISTFAANVTVNVSNNISTVGPQAFGMGTAIYDNINGSAVLPGIIDESGVDTLRGRDVLPLSPAS